MRHPFDLSLNELQEINVAIDLAIDLDFAEPLTDLEAAQVGSGLDVTTLALGEEGGEPITTKAVGEEGGATTLALGEEGGHDPHPPHKPWKPVRPCPPESPIYTTLALGEEGGTGW